MFLLFVVGFLSVLVVCLALLRPTGTTLVMGENAAHKLNHSIVADKIRSEASQFDPEDRRNEKPHMDHLATIFEQVREGLGKRANTRGMDKRLKNQTFEEL